VTLLHVLRLPEGQIAWKDAMRVAWQARRAGGACRSSGEQGLGVFADDGRRLVRGFVTGPGSVTVLADDQMALTATAEGLMLEKQGPRGGRVPIRGWRRTGADVSVLTDEAVAPLTDRHAVRMLTALAPGVDVVRTAPVALSRLFAGIVVNVADLAETAASVHRPLISRIGPPL
jgi:hypothetical protein